MDDSSSGKPQLDRRTFNTAEREAILHLHVLALEGRPIPLEVQKTLTAEEINSWFDADHWPHRWADGGPTKPWNGQMLLNQKGEAFLKKLNLEAVNEHRIKTSKVDIPEMAKAKRLARKIAEHRRKMQAKAGQGEPVEEPTDPRTRKPQRPKRRWPSRPMRGNRPMRGRRRSTNGRRPLRGR